MVKASLSVGSAYKRSNKSEENVPVEEQQNRENKVIVHLLGATAMQFPSAKKSCGFICSLFQAVLEGPDPFSTS